MGSLWKGIEKRSFKYHFPLSWLIRFSLNSNACLSFSTIVARISPEKNEIIAAIIIKPHTIKVGKLGTKPVFIYLIKIGRNSPAAVKVKIKAVMPKNCMGL